MSTVHCRPVVWLGESVNHVNGVAQRLSLQCTSRIKSILRPPTRSSFISDSVSNKGVMTHVLPVKKLSAKVPVWVLNPNDNFSAVRHLVLSQPCSACIVWLNRKQSDDDMIASSTKLILEFRRSLLPGNKTSRIPVYLAVERKPDDVSSLQASPDWNRVCLQVQEKLKETDLNGYKKHLRLHLSVIETDSNQFEPIMAIMEKAAQSDLEFLKESALLAKSQHLGSKMDSIRKACSSFIVPWQEYLGIGREKTGFNEIDLKLTSQANGQVIVVERQGWLPQVIVDVRMLADVLSRLLSHSDLQRLQSKVGFVSSAHINHVFSEHMSKEQLDMFMSALQDTKLAYQSGIAAGPYGDDSGAGWCIPLLNTNRRSARVWMVSQDERLRGSVRLNIPCVELLARIQVAIGQQFGVNNIDQWQDSCMLNAAPGILICTSPEHDVITWEVNDGNAHHQHRLVKDAVLEQCRCHISSVHFVVDEAVPDEAFQRVAHLSSDGDDTGFQHIYQDMRTRVVRISRNQQEEEPGRHASGPLQKHPPSEHGISADPNTMLPGGGDLVARGVGNVFGGGGSVSHGGETVARGGGSVPGPHITSQSHTASAVHVPTPPYTSPPPVLATPSNVASATASVRPTSVGGGSAVSSDGSLTDDSNPSSYTGESLHSVGSASSSSAATFGDTDDQELSEPPVEEGIEYASGHLLIETMKYECKRQLCLMLDIIPESSDRGWAHLLEQAGFSPDVESRIRSLENNQRTMAILDHAIRLGLSMEFLHYSLSRMENHGAVKIVDAAMLEIVQRNTCSPCHVDPPVDSMNGIPQPPPYSAQGTVGDIPGPPPDYFAEDRPDATPTYANAVSEEGPLVLVSYYHESEAFAADVAKWCETLRARGINVCMDSFEKERIRQHPGQIHGWKEEMYSQAKMVLVFGSPNYLAQAMSRGEEMSLQELRNLPNYPCGCGIKTEYSRLLIPGYTDRRISPVPIILRNFVREKRSECFPMLLQCPGCYILPSDEASLIGRLTGRNLVSRPEVAPLPPIMTQHVNRFSMHALRNRSDRHNSRTPPVVAPSPFDYQQAPGQSPQSRYAKEAARRRRR